MNAKDKKDEAELRKNPINEFTCCGSTMNLNDFAKHLLSEHGLDAKDFKGERQMLSHMDGTYWYSYVYRYKTESGVEFTQYTKQVRAKNDPMRD